MIMNDFLFGCIQGQHGVCELGDQRPPAPYLCLQDLVVERLLSQAADIVRLFGLKLVFHEIFFPSHTAP